MGIKKEIKRDAYAVKIMVEEEGQTIGRCYVYIMYNSLHAEPFAFLEDVFVEEGERGKGYGTKLVDLAVAEAKTRGCRKIIFTARNIKPQLQEWYIKLGFKDWGKEFRMDLI